MSEIIRIKKGLNIRLKGKAEKIFEKAGFSGSFAVKPTDFHGLWPKLDVKEGDNVKAGNSLFHDKYRPDILFTSPVSGKIKEINRGERRKILEVVIDPDKSTDYIDFGRADPGNLSREQIIDTMMKSGTWPYLRQRPYSIIANPDDKPKSIFISAFDTSPLGPDYDFIMEGMDKDFQTGIQALSRLTDGKIHLNINGDYPAHPVFSKAEGVQINRFTGPHPAGNVGIQIHHIDPLNKGDIVWFVNPQDLVIIGRLFNTGIYDASKVVALTGSEVLKPRYFKTVAGVSIEVMVLNNVNQGNLRYISGNVLTGEKITPNGYLGFYDSQVSVIPEGDHYELLGWASPGFNKFSANRSFWSWLRPNKEYVIDTNLHGGKRAYVMTGQYEKVVPMDIYPLQLVKSIIIGDIDLMEQLGIYEVSEEDFALCDFVCTSKTDVQSIIRRGLNMIRKEMA
ncbi:MAG: Na(+)-translocating NADH-quinone reductase subunit A [Bacteroidales bacterium]